jgi:hypothetical protein
MASVGSIVGGAFAVVRDRPGAVAMWGVAYVVGVFAIVLLCGLMVMGMMPSREMIGGDPGQMFGTVILMALIFYAAYFFLLAVLMNAVFRSVLRPEERSFASLRVGMDELRMFGLVLLVAIASFILSFLGQLLLALIGSVLTLALGGGAIAVLVNVVLFLAYVAAWIWLGVRLSLLYPVTFYRRRITIDGAWDLSRGQFWTLFLSYLVIFAIFLVIFGTIFWLTFGGLFAELAAAGKDPEAGRLVMMDFAARMSAISPLVWLMLVPVFAVISAVTFAIWNGLMAVATRELLLDSGETLDGEAEDAAAIFE